MSNMRYGASLLVIVPSEADPNGRPEELRFPVGSFQVTGGAHRKIDLASTNEGSIASEFEQARMYKNVVLYIKPDVNYPTNGLVNLSKSGKKNFSVAVTVTVHEDGGKVVRRYDLQSSAANFAEIPAPVGNTPPSLKTTLILNAARVLHGRRDEKFGGDIMEEV